MLFIALVIVFLSYESIKVNTVSSEPINLNKIEKFKKHSINGNDFQVLSSWKVKKIDNENTIYFYPSDGKMIVSFIETDKSIKNPEDRSSLIDMVINSDKLKNVSMTKAKETGKYSYYWNASFNLNNEDYSGEVALVDVSGGVLKFLIGTRNNSYENYKEDFSKILHGLNFYTR